MEASEKQKLENQVKFTKIMLVGTFCGVLKEICAFLFFERLPIILIPIISGFSFCAFMYFFILPRQYKHSPFISALLQIALNLVCLAFILWDHLLEQVLAVIYIYHVSFLSILFLGQHFFITLTIHFLSFLIATLLIFPPNHTGNFNMLVAISVSSYMMSEIFHFLQKQKESMENEYRRKSEFTDSIFTSFPESIFVYNEEKGIFYRNKRAHQFESKHRHQGNLDHVVSEMIDCSNHNRSLFHDLKAFNDNQFNSSEEVPFTSTTRAMYKVKNYFLKNAVNELDLSSSNLSTKREIFEVKLINYTGILEFPAILLVIVDVTHKLEMEQVKLAAKNKNILVCSVSHEVRTPLNHIFGIKIIKEFIIIALGLISLLREMKLGAQPEYFLNVMDSSTNFLLNKINDLQDLIELESDQFSLNFEEFSIKDVGNEVVNFTKLQLDKKEIEVKLVISNQIPDKIFADRKRITQILLNLLSNGIKYTESGEVVLIIGIRKDKIQFKVIDTGIGISVDKQRNIFTLYGTASMDHREMYSAKLAGLGLSISSLLCKKMGSELQVKSALNQGSTFYFSVDIFIGRKSKSSKSLVSKRKRKPFGLKKVKSVCQTRIGLVEEKKGEGDLNLEEFEEIPEEWEEEWGTLKNFRNYEFKSSTLQMMEKESKKVVFPLYKIGLSLSNRELRREESSENVFDSVESRLATCPDLKLEEELKIENTELEEEKCVENNILIVDDNDLNLLVLRNLLKKEGFHCDEAKNGKMAYEKCKTRLQANNNSCYRLILMDLQMPIMDGIEATHKIFRCADRNCLNNIAIVALTAYVTSVEKQKCLDMGMEQVLSKPIQSQSLNLLLHKCFPKS